MDENDADANITLVSSGDGLFNDEVNPVTLLLPKGRAQASISTEVAQSLFISILILMLTGM